MRQFLFFVSPRPIDFDSYLPTMMELKQKRPDWDIKVVCFDQANYDTILRNPVLKAGLDKSGKLHYCGTPASVRGLRRVIHLFKNFMLIAAWILRWSKPVLFLSVPFKGFPYRAWYLLAKMRLGNGYLLFKHRSPDEMHHLIWHAREPRVPKPRSAGSWITGGDQDAIIYYHDHQQLMIEDLAPIGWIENTPRIKIGIPHLFPAWRAHIEEEVEKQRLELEANGLPADAELYGFFPGKPGSNEFLRGPGSIERVFIQQMTEIARLRPNSYALVRPHPLAVHEEYVREGMAAFGLDRSEISFAHPEVLLRLCRRCFFNNPTNLLFHCFPGKMIDNADYPDHHYADRGEISIADGLGAVYIRPDREDFSERFSEAVENDELFDDPKVGWRLTELTGSGQPAFDHLMNLLDPRNAGEGGANRNGHVGARNEQSTSVS